MNIRALQSLCEVVDSGLSISDAAEQLHRSQPSVTRQIQELERELGFSIFERHRNRILRLTTQGEELLVISRRILHEVSNIHRLSGDVTRADKGTLVVATTNTQARHTLPRFLSAYTESFPNVSLRLQQADPVHCHDLVSTGQVDLAICTPIESDRRDIVFVPCYLMRRALIAPAGHPLLDVRELTLEAIAKYPIITYSQSFSGRKMLDTAFAAHGLHPHIVVNALDADVAKAFVEQGLGVAILATVSFNAERDTRLRGRSVARIIPGSELGVVVRRQTYLRGYMLAFIRAFAPHLQRSWLAEAIAGRDIRTRQKLPQL